MYGSGSVEHLAVGPVELARDVACHFDVLLLVLADGNPVGAPDQDVGRLQHRVREQPVVGRVPRLELLLVRDAALEQAHRRDRRQDPGELGDLGQIALPEQDRARGIDAERQEVERHAACQRAPLLRIANARERVQIGDEVRGPVAFLQRDELAQRAEVVAQVLHARRLDAREHARTADALARTLLRDRHARPPAASAPRRRDPRRRRASRSARRGER